MPELTQDRLRFLLTYDPDTGEFTWNVRRGGPTGAGSKSYCKDSKGYLRIGVDKTRYLAHRLAWFYVYGIWPDGVIDHVNRIRTDNRIVNLRVVPPSLNSINRTKSPNFSNPSLGVSFCRTGTYAGKWVAYITRRKKRTYIGYFKTQEEAIAARRGAEIAMDGKPVGE